MGVAVNIISAVLKSVVGDKIGNELANELIGISIDEASEKGINKISDFINGEKSKIERILSKENMKSMSIPEESIDYVVEEIKDLFTRINITDEVFRQCEYDSTKLSVFLWDEYCEDKGGYIECENSIKCCLNKIAQILIELLRESEGFEKDFLIQISNSVDDVRADEQEGFESLTERFIKLEENIFKLYNKIGISSGQEKKRNYIQLEANIDELLQDKFDKLFSSKIKNMDSDIGENSIRKMLYEIIGLNLVNSWGDSDEYNFDFDNELNEEDIDHTELTDDELSERIYAGDWLDPMRKFSGLEGKILSIADDLDTITLIYLINKRINQQTNEWWFEPEFLEYSEDEPDDGKVMRTYFADPSSEGNPLITISFIDDKEIVVVDVGFLGNDQVRFSQKPMIIPLEQSSFEVNGEGQIQRFLADKEKSIIIIDPEFHVPIERKEIYNEDKKVYETYIELQAGKKYFAYQFNIDKKTGESVPCFKASAHMLGYNYYIGQYGLKQNWLKAAEWLMQSDKPEDAYYLGVIFMKDKLLYDVSLAKKYLTKAMELEIEMAQELLEQL